MRWKFWLFGVVIFSVMGGVALAVPALDGTNWRLEITQKGAEVPQYVDRIRFTEGKFNSTIFQRHHGYLAAPYTVTEEAGSSVVWGITYKSVTEAGNLVWQGELKGNAMKGTLRWTQPDGTVVSYTFTGSSVER